MSRFAYLFAAAASACSAESATDRVVGQTDFVSSPVPGGGQRSTAEDTNATPPGAPPSGSTATRAVEETDLYRLEGNRLYYLNGYRGLMVFDVTDVDHPKLLGRSPIYGSPVEMLVRNGIATIVVADWYGQTDDGAPFHGSIVRGLDASDPSNIRVLGEAKLGGWIRDTRIVGDVLYAVSEDYGWRYGWEDGVVATDGYHSSVLVSSVNFAGGQVHTVARHEFPGYSGIFNVTPNAILLAHSPDSFGRWYASTQTELLYLDISDPAGAIVERGAITVDGSVQGWGPDNGRWNLDFADGKTAHVVGCGGEQWYCGSRYVLNTVDFSAPDHPKLESSLQIAGTGWSAAVRFVEKRMYLSPETSWYGDGVSTPFQVFDLSDPRAPKLAGATTIPGSVWNLLPGPDQHIFALGPDWSGVTSGDSVALKYLDVSSPAAPRLIGTATFGHGWAWTPAAGTFKAFTMDPAKGWVVLPFSGWNDSAGSYTNGMQLIEFSDSMVRIAGTARTKGWASRGIIVGERVVALSDTALSVIDYRTPDAPVVTAELTLARNVLAAQPSGQTIAELSGDWWGNESASELRILPLAQADEVTDVGAVPTVSIAGTNPRIFRNGDLAYVVSSVQVPITCPAGLDGRLCRGSSEEIQVIDLANGRAVLRGKVRLPVGTGGYYGWGEWGGCFPYDWFHGYDTVQVGTDALAIRRYSGWALPEAGAGAGEPAAGLFIIDLANPDAPSYAALAVTDEPNSWWGNLRVIGATLYVAHEEWFQKDGAESQWLVKYYADRIDLGDRQHPRVREKLNVPGLIVGGSDVDSTLLYTIDYVGGGTVGHNDFDVVRVRGDVAELVSRTTLPGYVGATILRGEHAYFTSEEYQSNGSAPRRYLHDLDLTDPTHPVDRTSQGSKGWGWLLDVAGDQAVVMSGWGTAGVDLYRLQDGAAPTFQQFVRTRGWSNGVARAEDALFLASGFWGVQRVELNRE